MRRNYPYLQDAYVYNSNEELEKRNFLSKIDEFINQKQYVRMTLLNWEEEPIKDIEGIITSGNFTKDGSSAVRTTCSLTCEVSYGEYAPQDIESDFAINKKIFIEIGIENETDEYPDFPILWFPQGVFFIGSFGISSSAQSSVSISLGLKDKMAGLNGDVGGIFPNTIQLNEMTTQLADGSYAIQDVPIYDIIKELINHYGNEPLNNILIEDIPDRIRQVVKWNGDYPIYLIQEEASEYDDTDTQNYPYRFTLNKPDAETGYQTFQTGDDVGYVLKDFIFPRELTVNAGTSIVSALTTIKDTLGNYEFFYDEYGIFHFREIKNYLNTTQGKLVLDEVSENQYLVEFDNSKVIYNFTDAKNIIDINVDPEYSNIKNDYVVLGLKQSTSKETSSMVMYHLAIDDKPEVIPDTDYYGIYGSDEDLMILYTQAVEGTNLTVAAFCLIVESAPSVGNSNVVYYDKSDGTYKVWSEEATDYVKLTLHEGDVKVFDSSNQYKVKDWRTQLYLEGLYAKRYGLAKNYYAEELEAFWPQVYDLENQCFYGENVEGSGSETKSVYKVSVDFSYDTAKITDYDISETKDFDQLENAINWANGYIKNTLAKDLSGHLVSYYVSLIPDDITFTGSTYEKIWTNTEKDSSGSLRPGIQNVNIKITRTTIVIDALLSPHTQWRTLTEGVYYLDFINAPTSELGKYGVGTIGRRTTVVSNQEINCLFQPEIPDVVFLNIDGLNNSSEEFNEKSTIVAQRQEANENGYHYTQVGNEIYENLLAGGELYGAYDEIKNQLYLHTYYETNLSLTALPMYYLEPNSRVHVQEGSTNTDGDYIIDNISFSLGPESYMSLSLHEVAEKM